MSDSTDSYLPTLLNKAQRQVENTRFYLSSIPNVEHSIGEGLLRQLQATRSILFGIRDYTILSEAHIKECIKFMDDVICPLQRFIHQPASSTSKPQPSTIPSKSAGRPRLDIDLERAIYLHNLGNTWDSIGLSIGCSSRTIINHLSRAGLSPERPSYTDIRDEDLDQIVQHISSKHPLSGGNIVRGHLATMGVNVPVYRVHASLKRVDEDGVALRWTQATTRRVYKVRGSNALWHQDGNEKLKPWGFYVHGCVDGHSRLIIYLTCTNNKRSKTVGHCFAEAVKIHGWPSRVRGDYGTENNEIERMMVRMWGLLHHAYLRGRSIHNVRIERLWRDVRRDSLEFFRRIFQFLEEMHLLNRDSKLHTLALYLVFQPRIQKSLNETTTSWNHHSLRTEHNKSPIALYELSKEHAINSGYWNKKTMGDDAACVDSLYGVEEGAFTAPVFGEDPIAPRSDNFAGLEEEKEAGIVITDDDEIQEGRDILGDLDLSERNSDPSGIDLYCEVVLRLTSYYYDKNNQ